MKLIGAEQFVGTFPVTIAIIMSGMLAGGATKGTESA